MIRLRDYVPWLQKGMVRAGRRARIVHETDIAAAVDGDLGLGQAIGEEAVAIGVAKAQAQGLSAVAVRNTGHLGPGSVQWMTAGRGIESAFRPVPIRRWRRQEWNS